MAINWQTFRTRTLSAVIFMLVMFAGLFISHWSFLLLFSIIHFGCWWEYLRLMEKIHGSLYHPYIKLGFMLIGFGLMLLLCGPLYQVNEYTLRGNLSLPVSAAGFSMLVLGIFQKHPVQWRAFLSGLVGVIYISLSLGLLMDISGMTVRDETLIKNATGAFNWHYPALIIFSLWINDTMAYLVGSMIGKTPLSPISPKKTWEGTLGGIILCIALAFLIANLIEIPGLDPAEVAIISAGAAVPGTLGDLLESKLKRRAGVKDSGSIMPGHGGFLDRFDSLLIAIPVCWCLLNFFLQ